MNNQSNRSYLNSLSLKILIIGATLWALWHSRELQVPDATLVANDLVRHAQQAPVFDQQLIDNAGQASVHSPSLTQTASGDIIAFWFAGSSEGAPDVAIYQSRLTEGSWSHPKAVFTRKMLSRQLGRHIAKLGNPVVFTDSGNRVWVFLVGVSIGGWSGSRIYITWSYDEGNIWQDFKQLSASPALNLGTLVRTPPLELSDGSLLLAAYHETISNFPQMLRIDSNGKLIKNIRLNGARAIQASLCPENTESIYALLRNSSDKAEGRKVLVSHSNNAGKNWLSLKPTNLENPHSSVSCLRTGEKQWILVGNRSNTDRSRLSLAISFDPSNSWHWIYDFENQKNGRYSYPAIIRDHDGYYHLLYSQNRQNIKHLRFNQSWLQQKITEYQ